MARLVMLIRIDGEQFEAFETLMDGPGGEDGAMELGNELVYLFKEWIEGRQGTWVDLQRGSIQIENEER